MIATSAKRIAGRAAQVDADLLDLAFAETAGMPPEKRLRPSDSWPELAAVVDAIAEELGIEFPDLWRAACEARTPAEAAAAVLEGIWDQGVAVRDGG